MSLALAPLPTIDPNTCGVGSAGADGCRACVDRCPYGAIDVRSRPEGSEIRIDPLLCQRCGACSGVCPTSSIERPFLPDDELISALIAAAGISGGRVVAVTCPHSEPRVSAGLGPEHVVVTSSLLILNETHLLAPIVAGARGVLLIGCPRCTHDQPESLLEPLSVTRAMIDEPRRVSYVEDDRSDRFETAVVITAELSAPRHVLEGDGLVELAQAATRRERLAVLLPAFGCGATVSMAATGFGHVELDLEACVACGACATSCPTDALALDVLPTAGTASLTVNDLECIGCGACASVCPDDALTVHPAVPVGSAALDRRTLLTDEAVACRTCGEFYAPRRLLDHARSVLEAADLNPDDPRFQLGICPTCRNPDARQHPISVTRGTDESCECAGACAGEAGPSGTGCACQSGSVHADNPAPTDREADLSRRNFLQGAATVAAVGAALPLFHGVGPAIAVEQEPVIRPGRMGMVIDLDRCIGCHACSNACKAENNVPLGKFRDWVEEHVLGEYPDARPVFLPKLCNHCDDPGCLRACPTGAIHKRADGIVDLDPEICIGCKACMNGCPYGMTFFNHTRGTADKCNLCAHRIDQGLNPACVDVCPSQCRIVGDFDDPDSPVSQYLADRDSTVLRGELGLGPNIQYVGLPGELER